MNVVLMEGKMNTKKNERFAETDRRIRKAFTKMVLNKKTCLLYTSDAADE